MVEHSRFSEELVERKIQEYTNLVVRIMTVRGILTTEEEALRHLYRTLSECIFDFFKEKGFIFTISDAWDSFKEDYAAYRTGTLSGREGTDVWMWYDNLPDDSFAAVVGRTADVYGITFAKDNASPASLEQKRLFFRLLEATCLPIIDYYRPRPKSEARYQPENRVTHVYSKSSTMVVEYNCVDDGGLVNDDAPIGKTFTLVNDIGLRAAVKIVEKREPPFNLFECDKDNYAPLGRYLAKGFIEGYTVFGEEVPDDKIPGIVIRMDENGEIVKLGIFPYTEADSAAFYSFPLWQEYFAENNKYKDWKSNHDAMILEAAQKVYEAAGSPQFAHRKSRQ